MLTTELSIYFNENSIIAERFFDLLFGKEKGIKNPIRRKLIAINPMDKYYPNMKDTSYPYNDSLATVMIVKFEDDFTIEHLDSVKETLALLQKQGFETAQIVRLETDVTIVSHEKRTWTI